MAVSSQAPLPHHHHSSTQTREKAPDITTLEKEKRQTKRKLASKSCHKASTSRVCSSSSSSSSGRLLRAQTKRRHGTRYTHPQVSPPRRPLPLPRGLRDEQRQRQRVANGREDKAGDYICAFIDGDTKRVVFSFNKNNKLQ